jgi:hypothetical protein
VVRELVVVGGANELWISFVRDMLWIHVSNTRYPEPFGGCDGLVIGRRGAFLCRRHVEMCRHDECSNVTTLFEKERTRYGKM